MTEIINSEWQPKIINLRGGLNSSDDETIIDDSESPAMSNIAPYRKIVRSDTGYEMFLNTLNNSPGRRSVQFYRADGTIENLIIRNSGVLKYDSGTETWYDVSDGTATTTSGALVDDTTVPVAARDGFAANDRIVITLDSGVKKTVTITSGYVTASGAGNLTLVAPGIDQGAGEEVTSGNAVWKAVKLNGTNNHQVVVLTIEPDDSLVFTNNADPVKIYDGDTVETLAGLPSSGNTICRSLGWHEGHLLLLDTTEGGTRHPHRVRNSDTNNITEWTTGNAGFEDIYSSNVLDEDYIAGGAPLGPYFIIYKTRSIFRQEYVGSDDRLFQRDQMISDEGVFAPLQIVDMRTYHLIWGQTNVYKYRGGFDKEPVGNDIKREFFSAQGRLNLSVRDTIFGFYVEELDEVWFFLPVGSSTVPNLTMRYTIEESAWFPRTFPHSMLGFGFFRSIDTVGWHELVGSWLAQNFAWDTNSLSASSSILHLMDYQGAAVFSYNFISTTDETSAGAEVPIAFSIETKDFQQPGYLIRVDNIVINAKGEDVQLAYSIDSGQTWTDIGSAMTSSSFQYHHRPFNQASESIRFRLSGDGPSFELRNIYFDFCLESPW